MSRLPLNNLNVFAIAAQNLSFQKAAEQLHVTPSAVSHQVRNLEQLLGFPLFERMDKCIRLTARGEQLFADIRLPFRQIHEAGAKALRGMEDNTLVLSVAPVFATRWLVPRVKDFQSRHPGISLSILATTDLVNFITDPVDASIRVGDGNWPELASCLLFQKEIVAVCNQPMLKRNNDEVFQAEDFAMLTLVQNSSMPDLWAQWFDSQGMTLPPDWKRLEVQNSAQVLEAIHAGDCIGLIDSQFIQGDLALGRVVLASDHTYRGEGGYYLSYPQKTTSLTSFNHFKNWLLQAIESDSTQRA